MSVSHAACIAEQLPVLRENSCEMRHWTIRAAVIGYPFVTINNSFTANCSTGPIKPEILDEYNWTSNLASQENRGSDHETYAIPSSGAISSNLGVFDGLGIDSINGSEDESPCFPLDWDDITC
jgi:hypothetical protein